MQLYFEGVILAICTFLIIGVFHPLVIKTEYYFGTKPWIVWLISGLVMLYFRLIHKRHILVGIIGCHWRFALMGDRRAIRPEKTSRKRMVSNE